MKVSISMTGSLDGFKRALATLCKTYQKSVPLDHIADLAKSNGLSLLDEDGSEWSGLVTGREGRCQIDLGTSTMLPTKHVLNLQWYKMPSGNFEINAYVS